MYTVYYTPKITDTQGIDLESTYEYLSRTTEYSYRVTVTRTCSYVLPTIDALSTVYWGEQNQISISFAAA